jgi:glycosyltransferase involved in cell wall biosynthesis
MLNYCALIPARNEAQRIAATVAALRARKEIGTILVIDDSSADETGSLALSAGASRVVRTDRRRGKGGALEFGIANAPEEAEVFLFLDADLGDSATECAKLIRPIELDEADMTIGMLPPDPELVASGETGGGMGLVVGMARAGLARRTGIRFEQPLAGQRCIRRSIIDAMGGKLPAGFGVEVGLTLSAIKLGFRVLEVETVFRHRVTGSDFRSHLHRARQLIDVALALRA